MNSNKQCLNNNKVLLMSMMISTVFLGGCDGRDNKTYVNPIPDSKPEAPLIMPLPPAVTGAYTLSGTISGLTLSDLTVVDQFSGRITTIKKGSKTFSLNDGKLFLENRAQYGLVLASSLSVNQNSCSMVNGAGVALNHITNVEITCSTPIATRLAGAAETGVELDGRGTAAVFGDSNTSVLDLSGNFWVGGPGDLRKVTALGDVTTPIFKDEGLHEFVPSYIQALAVDQHNNLYTSSGLILSPLGISKKFLSRLPFGTEIKGLAFDSKGNLYISDKSLHVIYKLPPVGAAVVLAGSSTPGLIDGQGKSASFNFSGSYDGYLAIDSQDNIYVTEAQNEDIRKITAEGLVSTFTNSDTAIHAGYGPDNFGISSGAITIDAHDNLYILNSSISSVFKVTPSGQVSTLISSGVLTLADGSFDRYAIRSISVNAAGDLTLMTGSVGKGSGQVLTIKFE